MTRPGIWSATVTLGVVAPLLWGCGVTTNQHSPQYAALHPANRPVVELRPVSVVPEPVSSVPAKPRPVRSLLEMRRENVVIQNWDLSCGAAALATLLRYEFGENLTEKEVAHGLMRRSEYVQNPKLLQAREGFSLLDLKRYVQTRGYKGTGFGKLEFNDLVERAPVMVPINALGYNHFAIFRGVRGNRVLLADPAWGNRTMTIEKFERMWLDYGESMGHVGFVVERADGGAPVSRLAPKLNEFVMLQ